MCQKVVESCQNKNSDYHGFFRKNILDAIFELVSSYDCYICSNECLYEEFLVNLYPIIELIKNLSMNIENFTHFRLFCYFYSKIFSINIKLTKSILILIK
jgi:hypothetical protein